MLPQPAPTRKPPVRGLTLLLLFALASLYDYAALGLAVRTAQNTYVAKRGASAGLESGFFFLGCAVTAQLLLAVAFALKRRRTYALVVGIGGVLLGACAGIVAAFIYPF